MPNEDGKLKPAVPSQSCLLVPALYHPDFHHPTSYSMRQPEICNATDIHHFPQQRNRKLANVGQLTR